MTVGLRLYVSCLEDEWLWGGWWPQVLGHVAVPRLHRRHFYTSLLVPTDLKVRGYWPSASRLSDALSLSVRRLGGFDLCIV